MKAGCFINGVWRVPDSKKTIKNINPANTRDVISEFPAAGKKEIKEAIEAAKNAYKSWRYIPAPERGRYILKVAEIAKKDIDNIARVMTREQGKLLREAAGEVKKGINVLEYYSGAGFRLEGKTIPSESRSCFTYTVRCPLGPVGIITPWNFPWAIPCWKIAPAIVSGNTVVFKPSELPPGTAELLVGYFHEAGLPQGVLNMVVCDGPDFGEVILPSPQIKAISFTGSNNVGNYIMQEAVKTGKKVTCEMGGKNALILMEDGNVSEAVAAALDGAFGSTGQRCTATSRILVHRAVREEFTALLLDKAKNYRPGCGMEAESTIGPSIDNRQYQSVLEYIEIGKKEGAKLIHGGKMVKHEGYFIEPTVFDCVSPDMRVFQEEIFGPVLTITEIESLDEAIELANSVKYGLSGAIFTSSIDKAMKYIDNIEVGMAHVNEPTIGGEAQLPFGGTKATSYGNREMEEEGLHFFTETKTVFINYSGSGQRILIR